MLKVRLQKKKMKALLLLKKLNCDGTSPREKIDGHSPGKKKFFFMAILWGKIFKEAVAGDD